MGVVLVYEDGLTVRCGYCRLNMWWTGKKPRVRACGCTADPEPKPAFGGTSLKTREVTAKVGRRGEKRTLTMLTGSGLLAKQTAGSGATASRSCERAFDTDIVTKIGDMHLKIEVKTLAKVPGLTSFRNLLSGSDMLRVEQDGEGFWFLPDDIAKQVFGLAAEAGAQR